jgi:hypothetical protein
MYPWPVAAEDLAFHVDGVVADLLETANWGRPPVDALALARRHLGIEVSVDPQQANRGRAQRNGAGRLIYIRPENRPERMQWAIAHELGEHLRPRIQERLPLTEPMSPELGEHLANLFAARLLVPTRWFAGDAARLRCDLLKLKEHYATASHEVLAWRLLDLPRPCVVTIVDDNRLTRRRSNAWEPPRTLLSAEVRCQRFVHEKGEPGIVHQDGWTIQGWPVHESTRRREILRATWEE